MKRSAVGAGGNGLRSGLVFHDMIREIRAGVAAGELAAGDRLPSESALAARYGISVNSVRRGIDELIREGAVVRRRGSGTYILEQVQKASSSGRPDTVLFACSVQHVASHPFFGKRDQALRMRLSELGWKSEHVARMLPPERVGHTVWHEVDADSLPRRVESDKSVAGVVVDRITADSVSAALAGRLPCVSLSEHSSLPYADYCWSDELGRAVALLGRLGAKRVHIISGHSDDELAKAAATGCALASSQGAKVCADFTRVPYMNHSKTVHESFLVTRRLLWSARGKPDGLVMGSDVHAQGGLDALADVSAELRRNVGVVAFVNKGGALSSSIPFTAFEADGEAAGRACAELLDKLISVPQSAPARVILSCSIHVARPRDDAGKDGADMNRGKRAG